MFSIYFYCLRSYDGGFDSTEYGIFYGTEDECQKYADEINGGK